MMEKKKKSSLLSTSSSPSSPSHIPSISPSAKTAKTATFPGNQDTEEIKDNLLALGIDIDLHLIQRLQKLGLHSTLQSTSRAADSIRSRNPYGMSSAIMYQNIEDPTEYIFQEKREIELEWNPIDKQRIYQILSDLYHDADQENIKSIIDLIHILRVQYIRSSDRFVDKMLASRKSKGRLSPSDLMKTRYVSNTKFLEIIKRLYKDGTFKQINSLFLKLSQQIDLSGGGVRTVVDLKSLLFLLEIANGDSRRTFEDKTSKISTNVEFWTSAESWNGQHSILSDQNSNKIYSSKGYLVEESYNSHSHTTVASLIGGIK